jgi:formate-dependent nitrite reductase membrane component NrfD
MKEGWSFLKKRTKKLLNFGASGPASVHAKEQKSFGSFLQKRTNPTPDHQKTAWTGPTYYGRAQLKEAPFDNRVVGGYIFLAGVSGAAMLISGIAEATIGRRARPMARHGRYLSLLAPTIGAALLVYDLHTPKRFYNMLRIAKPTSPMSIGTWILMAFTGCAFTSAGAQFLVDQKPRWSWLRNIARIAHAPAALAGAGLSTYTASLLASTSTPLWAAAPKALAVRFGSSSVAAGAAALSLFERSARNRRALDQIMLAALTTEFAATIVTDHTYRARGVDEAYGGGRGALEKIGGDTIGMVLPAALIAASLAPGQHASRRKSGLAAFAILAGSLFLRISIMSAGDRSARQPDISMRFSQPGNLPRKKELGETCRPPQTPRLYLRKRYGFEA